MIILDIEITCLEAVLAFALNEGRIYLWPEEHT